MSHTYILLQLVFSLNNVLEFIPFDKKPSTLTLTSAYYSIQFHEHIHKPQLVGCVISTLLCMCVYICTYMYVCIHVCIYVYRYTIHIYTTQICTHI